MAPILSKVRKKKLLGQSREIVSNVMNFMTTEAMAQGFTIPVQKAQVRTAAATGVSVRMLQGIKKELAEIERGEKRSFTTPDTSREKTKSVTGLNEFDRCVVRRTVHEFYVKEKCCPTTSALKERLQKSIGFKGCCTSLRHILKEIGFTSTRTKNFKKVLVEDMDIRSTRVMYLKRLKHYREKNHPIVYTDEIFLTGHDCTKKCTDNCDKRVFCPLNKGQQLVIVHAGGADGFVPNAYAMWSLAKHTTGSNNKLSSASYMHWAETKLLPNLKPNSVVVMDNAAHHNVQKDKAPTCNAPRQQMMQWLTEHSIPYSPDMLKPQLYELVRLHKPPDGGRYVLDDLYRQHGHIVLRLPRHHSDLNPIELIWVKLKIWLAEQNKTCKIHDLARECERWLHAVSKGQWMQVCSYVETIEKQYADNEGIIDTETEKILNSFGGERSDSDEDLEQLSSDDCSGSEEEDSDEESSCLSSESFNCKSSDDMCTNTKTWMDHQTRWPWATTTKSKEEMKDFLMKKNEGKNNGRKENCL